MQHVARGRYAHRFAAAPVIEGRPGRRPHGIEIRTTTLWQRFLPLASLYGPLRAAGKATGVALLGVEP
jgi:hypothetical protein